MFSRMSGDVRIVLATNTQEIWLFLDFFLVVSLLKTKIVVYFPKSMTKGNILIKLATFSTSKLRLEVRMTRF